MFGKKKEEESPVKQEAEVTEKVPAAEAAAERPAAEQADAAEVKSAEAEVKEAEAAAEESAGQASAEPAKPAEPDWKALYAVTLADFDNYKKRAARDREDVYRYAESDILKDVLPTVDNLGLALESAKNQDDEFVKGVRLIYDGLLKALEGHGAKPMADLVGRELDPNFHEAIATLPSAEVEEGRISNVAKTGWTLNDRLLRAAQVVVSSGKPQ